MYAGQIATAKVTPIDAYDNVITPNEVTITQIVVKVMFDNTETWTVDMSVADELL